MRDHKLLRTLHKAWSQLRPRLPGGAPVTAEPSAELYPAGESTVRIVGESRRRGTEAGFEVTWPAAQRFDFKDTYLAGDQGAIYDHHSHPIVPIAADFVKPRWPIRALAKRLEGRFFHFTGYAHNNRAHLVTDQFPKLYALLKRSPSALEKVAVAPTHAVWQREYLALFGIRPEQVVEISPGTSHVEHLIYVTKPGRFGHLSAPALLAETLGFLQEQLPARPSAPHGAVFISRSDAPQRRILNEDDLVAKLEQYFSPSGN